MKKIYLFIFTAIFISCFTETEAQTFEYKESGTDFILYDLTIPKGQNLVAYAAGAQYTMPSDGVIIKTTDAGETWETIYPLTGTSPGFEKIEFITSEIGFATGYDIVLKTTDGGETWEELQLSNDVYMYNDIQFYDENIGFISALLDESPYFELNLTTDGGETWTPTTDITAIPAVHTVYGDQNTMYSVGSDERVAKSTDGGQTWELIYTGIIGDYSIKAEFKDADNGIVSGDDGRLRTTHDGGSTWSEFSTGFHHFYALAYVGEQIIAAGSEQEIYASQNGGQTYDMIFSGGSENVFYEIAFFENGSGLICGSGGKMLKFDDLLLGTQNNELLNENLVSFYNPQTSLFTVKSNLSIIDNLEIYSVSGQKLMDINSASNELRVDMSSLSKGVYIALIKQNTGATPIKFVKH